MSKNFEDMTKEEKLEAHKETRWYAVGRAGMLEQLSITFLNRAAGYFKRGNDSSAQEFRELSLEMQEMAIAERKSQFEINEKIEALEKQDEPDTPSP